MGLPLTHYFDVLESTAAQKQHKTISNIDSDELKVVKWRADEMSL